MSDLWILEGREAKNVDVLEWSKWRAQDFETTRRVAKTKVGDAEVSTVFIGIDHGFGGDPQLFESMVFGGDKADQYQLRYATWEQAEAGHAAIVAFLEGTGPDPWGDDTD